MPSVEEQAAVEAKWAELKGEFEANFGSYAVELEEGQQVILKPALITGPEIHTPKPR